MFKLIYKREERYKEYVNHVNVLLTNHPSLTSPSLLGDQEYPASLLVKTSTGSAQTMLCPQNCSTQGRRTFHY